MKILFIILIIIECAATCVAYYKNRSVDSSINYYNTVLRNLESIKSVYYIIGLVVAIIIRLIVLALAIFGITCL